jgi:peroxin-19
MADLLGELERDPNMQKQFEDLIKDLGNAASGGGIPEDVAAEVSAAAAHPKEAIDALQEATEAGATSKDAAKNAEASFQDTIRKTMERMQESSSSADAAAQNESEDDILAQMLKEMEKGGFGGPEGGDEGFSKMLMGMMEQLTNKDILYEPMKELDEKFPAWLEQNREKLQKENPDDLKRYEEQQKLVAEITKKFEEDGYSDESPSHREYIVDRMQKVD